MKKHEHDPTLRLDGLISCRTCGDILPEMIEEITTVSSRRRAESTLQTIAVEGGYRASGMRDGFVVYSKTKDGNEEEVSVQKKKKLYKVMRRISRLLGSDKTKNN